MAINPCVAAFSVSGFLLMVAAAPLYAQDDSPRTVGPEGHVVGVLGGWSTSFSSSPLLGAAAGGGVRFGRYLGVGVEVGAYAGRGMLLNFSTDGRVRIVTRRGQRLVPFVSSGYSYLNLITGDASGLNVGGGVEYDLNPRRALRIEFRNMIKKEGTRSPSNFWFIRTGITFR